MPPTSGRAGRPFTAPKCRVANVVPERHTAQPTTPWPRKSRRHLLAMDGCQRVRCVPRRHPRPRSATSPTRQNLVLSMQRQSSPAPALDAAPGQHRRHQSENHRSNSQSVQQRLLQGTVWPWILMEIKFKLHASRQTRYITTFTTNFFFAPKNSA